MFEVNENKVFIVDYFIYTPNSQQRKIHSFMLHSPSRKAAEQSTRDLEKTSKITIVKIQSFTEADVDFAFHEEFKLDSYV